MLYDECGHLFTSASHQPARICEHGVMWVDKVRCKDCDALVVLRVYDDPRDDRLRLALPPDGGLRRTSKEDS
jgi:hypothetical protein